MKNNNLRPCALLAFVTFLGAGSAASSPSPYDTPGAGAGLSEQQIQQFETRLLGHDHAAEHAEARAYSREVAQSITTGTLERLRQFVERLMGDRRTRTGNLDFFLDQILKPAHAVTGAPDQVGQWAPSFPMPVMGIHAVLLPTGKVLFFSYRTPKKNTSATSTNGGVAYLWNPADGTGKRVDPPNNIWCGGQALLADGRVLVVGGTLNYASSPLYVKGLNQAYIFNPYNETWIRQPDMRHGRWYPTLTTLADGRVVITNGLTEVGDQKVNYEIEIFTPSADFNGVGTVAYAGNYTAGGLYPHQFLMPNGQMLLAGPGRTNSSMFNPTNGSWTDLPDLKQNHNGYGSGVLLPGGTNGSNKVMLIGGIYGGVATARTEVFDAANPAGGWQYKASLPQGRRNNDTVILPDGKLLTLGGNNSVENYTNPQFEAQMYDPATNTWSAMATQVEPRAYHSTALLLPDGRVVSAGDDGAPIGSARYTNDAVEIFSPPYLFRGPRPTIGAAPATLNWGQSFTITTPDIISKAVLIAPGATTHGNNMHQRYVPLAITPVTGGVTATAPPSANVAPPGYYMLFVLNDLGAPSVAKWVRVSGVVAPSLQFSAAKFNYRENVGGATISVTRVGGSGAVTVDYASANGTAVAGTDYTATTGTISFADGDTAPKTFTVPITNDASAEGTETVNLKLSNPTGGAVLGTQSSAVLNILNDDVYLQFKAATVDVTETAGSAVVSVRRVGGSPGTFTVDYATSDGSALAGTDYTAASGTLSWGQGDYTVKTFSVPIIDDLASEGVEKINLTLSNPTGGELVGTPALVGTPGTAVINITSNE